MSHNHPVLDTDNLFVIDPLTRVIKAQSSKTSVVQYDHNSERFSFELPRFIEGHDMMTCNKVEVHYLNAGNGKDEKASGVYEVDDLQEMEGENKVTCSWLISAGATQYAGKLAFLLRFCCLEDETVTYAWNTAPFDRIHVTEGMNASATVVLEYSDILEKWKASLFAAGYINAETMQQDIKTLQENAAVEKGRVDKLSTYVTPQMFGAKADGVTDDTKAVQEAIASGLPVHLPAGEYLLGAFTVDKKCRIFGASKSEVTLKCQGLTLAAAVQLSGVFVMPVAGYTATGVQIKASGCSISDCDIYSFNIGLELSSEKHIIGGVFKNLTIGYCKHAGVKSVASGNSQKNQILFEHLYVVNCGVGYADDTAESTKLQDGFGMYIDGGYAVEVRNCVFEYNTGVGLYLARTYPLWGCCVTSPYFEHNKYAQLYVANSTGTYMRNVHISGEFYTDAGRGLPSDALDNRELYVESNVDLKNGPTNQGNHFSKASDFARSYANRYCPQNLFPYDVIGDVVSPHVRLAEYRGERVWAVGSGAVRFYGCNLPIEPGEYAVSYEVAKSSDAAGTCVFGLVGHGDGSKTKTLQATTEWLKVEFTLTFNSVGVCDPYAENGSGHTFYFRNIRITKK